MSKETNESYKVHYPSLKKMTQLQYTDPRVNTEGKTIHVEKEGNFRQGDSDTHGHYVVYEDAGMPGSFIGVHIGSDINEESGEAPVSVVAMGSNRSNVLNRVAYRMRKSHVQESEVMEESTNQKMVRLSGLLGEGKTFGKLKIGDTFKMLDDPDNATLEKVSNTHYMVKKGPQMKGSKYKMDKNQEIK